ncbi:aspartate carbamoyltransferase regulatory subunit, partial [bacterium]
MLEVKGIQNGIVLDHIASGNGLKVFDKLQLAKVESPVVLLMNVESNLLGRKDIIKIENTFDVDLTILGLIDSNISVCIIKDGRVVEKKKVFLPKEIKGLITCKNPRCITNHDDYIDPVFKLVSEKPLEYMCSYCEEITR